jgi:hypothetical protein
MRKKMNSDAEQPVANRSLKDLRGMFRGKVSRTVTIEEMNAVIAQCAVEGAMGKANGSRKREKSPHPTPPKSKR